MHTSSRSFGASGLRRRQEAAFKVERAADIAHSVRRFSAATDIRRAELERLHAVLTRLFLTRPRTIDGRWPATNEHWDCRPSSQVAQAQVGLLSPCSAGLPRCGRSCASLFLQSRPRRQEHGGRDSDSATRLTYRTCRHRKSGALSPGFATHPLSQQPHATAPAARPPPPAHRLALAAARPGAERPAAAPRHRAASRPPAPRCGQGKRPAPPWPADR
ncbi:MAG: hypothetical protein RL291_1335 [Pseudomonadota bacterium]